MMCRYNHTIIVYVLLCNRAMILCELNLYKLHHVLSLIYIINFRGTISFQIDLNWQVLLTPFKCMAQAHCHVILHISAHSVQFAVVLDM